MSGTVVAGRERRPATGLAAVSVVCLFTGAVLVGRQLYLEAKALAAGMLIDRVWSERLDDGRTRPPWPWADFTPIARLEVRRLGIDRPILSDASGRTLAFGLGHVPGTARPGEPGACVIAGHRDTWAAFLRELRPGEEVLVRAPAGGRRYRITGTAVVDAREYRVEAGTTSGGVSAAASGVPADVLVLTTCWPFGAVRSGTLRYVVLAAPV